MRKAIIITIGALGFLAGCGNQDNSLPAFPFRPSGRALPTISHLARRQPSPTRRASPFRPSSTRPIPTCSRPEPTSSSNSTPRQRRAPAGDGPMVMGAVDVSGTEGELPAAYVDKASADLANMLAGYCVKGKVKISVVLTKSSIPLSATSDLVNARRLSDWRRSSSSSRTPIQSARASVAPKSQSGRRDLVGLSFRHVGPGSLPVSARSVSDRGPFTPPRSRCSQRGSPWLPHRVGPSPSPSCPRMAWRDPCRPACTPRRKNREERIFGRS